MKKNLLNGMLIAGSSALLLALNGCIAIPLGVAAFGVYKVAQNETKSSVSVTFAVPTVADTNALASVKTVAVWPEDESGQSLPSFPTVVAEALTDKFAVVTPLGVSQVLRSHSLSANVAEMTAEERAQACRTVAAETKADAVLMLSSSGMKQAVDFFSLSRASATYGMEVSLYSASADKLVWRDTMNVSVATTAKRLSDAEIQQEAATNLVVKILEITGRKP